MAARLTVVVSQSSIRHRQAAGAEERLLSELMMTAGLDTTLIGSLDNVKIDSTDYLCLSGLANQRLAVISALSFDEVAEQWKRLQLDGQVTRMGAAGSVAGRRVYYFSLTSNVESTLAELRQLHRDQTVKTIDLLMPLGKATQPTDRAHDSRSGVGKGHSSQPERRAASPKSMPLHAAQREPVETSVEQWPNLDQLVDDFDALDL